MSFAGLPPRPGPAGSPAQAQAQERARVLRLDPLGGSVMSICAIALILYSTHLPVPSWGQWWEFIKENKKIRTRSRKKETRSRSRENDNGQEKKKEITLSTLLSCFLL